MSEIDRVCYHCKLRIQKHDLVLFNTRPVHIGCLSLIIKEKELLLAAKELQERER